MNHDIAAWLEHLRILFPPAGAVLVGAGAGTGDWVQLLAQWNAANVTLIEADDTQFQYLQRSTAREGWHLCKQVIARETETVTFHQASNAAESGLLEPETLRNLWPNLKTVQKQPREAISLADLLQDESASANWLLVDCLPALLVIQGAGSLPNVDVIAARVLIEEQERPDLASLSVLQDALVEHGFQLLSTQSSRHPAIGHALFVRDVQAELRKLRTEQADEKNKHQREAEQRTQLAETAIARQTAESAAQLEAARQAQAAAEKRASECQKHVEQLMLAKSQVDKVAAEKTSLLERALSQVDVLSAEKEKVKKLLEEQMTLLAEHQGQRKLAVIRATEIESLRQIADDSKKHAQRLESERNDAQKREEFLKESLIKAGGQIELIKELLLRDQKK
jgi:hypothetical protein